jgi:S1-C subfamily serine protease
MKRHARLLAAAALAVATTACADDPSPTGSASGSAVPSSQPAAGAITLEAIPDLVAEVQPSVVSILRADGAEGSGVIWDADGVIVTNNHVVSGQSEVAVAFADGQRLQAEVVATDPRTDLAVIIVDRDNLPAATFSDELPRLGDLALALGNPLGFENSVSQGVVSGIHRSIPGSAQVSAALVDLIQTDAAISPGNSGGALVGADGLVMGVNVAYIPPPAGAVSIGFAIPATTVASVVPQLLEDGTAEHAYLGVQPATVTPDLVDRFNLGVERGVIVVDATGGGPAAEAGIEPGDVITAIDDQRIASVEDLLGALRAYRPGDEVEVTFERDGEARDITVVVQDAPLPG